MFSKLLCIVNISSYKSITSWCEKAGAKQPSEQPSPTFKARCTPEKKWTSIKGSNCAFATWCHSALNL